MAAVTYTDPVLTLILGGVRSGKSELAQRLAGATGRPVVFVATMQPLDDELWQRIQAHRAARPAAWTTVEAPHDVVAALDEHAGPGTAVVIDCLTLWTSNLLLDQAGDGEIPAERGVVAIDAVVHRAAALAERATAHAGDVIVVSNEVGAGVVPATRLGRLFRDALGGVNRTFAARADRLYYVVAGLALEIKSLGARPLDAFGR